MKKYTLFCFSLFCLSLFGEVEYDIVLLAPEGEEFLSESDWDCAVTLNDAGYAAGSIRGENGDMIPYVYHQDLGFKTFSLPENSTLYGEDDGVRSINKHGVAVGVYGESYYDPKIFVIDSRSGECFDLFDSFGTDLLDGMVLERLFITDDNKVIFGCTSDFWDAGEVDLRICIYDLNTLLATLFSEKGLSDVNKRGQMVGFECYCDCAAPVSSWLFDPEEGLKKIGSLDKFKRWQVKPKVISSSGVVAGIGFDSYRENKGFVWSPDFGMHAFDIFGDWYSIIGVNDQGSVIGVSEVDDEDGEDYSDKSFIFSLEKGFLDLGNFGGEVTVAFGINNQNQVVGISETKAGKDRAFVWDFEHGMRELDKLIPNDSGWKVLTEAVAINHSGCIVGFGKYYGADHHFLLIPKKSSN